VILGISAVAGALLYLVIVFAVSGMVREFVRDLLSRRGRPKLQPASATIGLDNHSKG